MSQVTADGPPEDGCLGLIPTHPCLQPIHLQPQKGSKANDPEWRRLCALAPAPPHSIASALDESPIPFSPTPLASPPSSSGHWSPSIPRPRFGKKYPDKPKALQMHHPPLQWDFHLPNSPADPDSPDGCSSAGSGKPAEGGDEFQLSISTYSGLKPRS